MFGCQRIYGRSPAGKSGGLLVTPLFSEIFKEVIYEDFTHEKNITGEQAEIVEKLYGYLSENTDGEIPTLDIQWTF